MIGVLLVIAAANAWSALVERELPRFHLAISGAALVLAAIVAISRYQFPVRSEPAKEETLTQRRVGLLLAISGSLASVLWIAFAPWQPAADFDATGFLFVVQNMGPLAVLGILVVIGGAGLAIVSRR